MRRPARGSEWNGKTQQQQYKTGSMYQVEGVSERVRVAKSGWVLIALHPPAGLSEILCVGHSLRNIYAPHTEKPDTPPTTCQIACRWN